MNPSTCKCFARCEADCVCDYDWTPPEVIRLRATIPRLREYADHKPTCAYRWTASTTKICDCDCGYDELMANLEGSK